MLQDMGADDLFNIFFLYAYIKSAFWVYGHGRTKITDAQTSRPLRPHAQVHTEVFQLLFELGHQLEAMRFAAAPLVAACALVGAYKNMHVEDFVLHSANLGDICIEHMARVLITGGSGMLGKALVERLVQDGHMVSLLSRSPGSSTGTPVTAYKWDVAAGYIDPSALAGISHVVHLAGAGIADQRWSEARKKEITDSRVMSMVLLEREIMRQGITLTSFVGASAVGYYGMVTSPVIFTEQDRPATRDFLVRYCEAWEGSYQQVPQYAQRQVILRIGVVLSSKGGALKKMRPVFAAGLGSPLGSGRQYMPWVHLSDLTEIICHSLFNGNMRGTYNAVTPEVVTNLAFSKAFAASLHKSFFLPPVPGFVLKLLYGEMAGMLLEGSRVSCSKLLGTGFRFRYGKIEAALAVA